LEPWRPILEPGRLIYKGFWSRKSFSGNWRLILVREGSFWSQGRLFWRCEGFYIYWYPPPPPVGREISADVILGEKYEQEQEKKEENLKE
jgi:hypothetical protein